MTELSMSIQKYVRTLNSGGRFQYLDIMAEDSKSPYLAILNDVFIIGPLMVHHRTNGQIHAINSEQGTVSADFNNSSAGHAREQFISECGPKKPGSYLWLWNIRAYNIWHWIMEALLSCSFYRIYIARQNPSLSRRIDNELQLMEVLFKYGFQRVVMENYSLKEQIAISAGANCLVAPHGAGMVNCLFMKPQSLIIELFPTTYINPYMLPIIDSLQHRYFMIPSSHKRVGENDNYDALI